MAAKKAPRARRVKAPKRKCRCGAYLVTEKEKNVTGKCSFCELSGLEPRDYPAGGAADQVDKEWERERKRKPRKARSF
jgi:hypothetical protein